MHSHLESHPGPCEGRNVVTDTTTAPDTSGALSAMKLPQLQALASELGVSGASKMKKSDLVDAINNGGVVANAPAATAEAPARDESQGDRARRAAEAVATAASTDAP